MTREVSNKLYCKISSFDAWNIKAILMCGGGAHLMIQNAHVALFVPPSLKRTKGHVILLHIWLKFDNVFM